MRQALPPQAPPLLCYLTLIHSFLTVSTEVEQSFPHGIAGGKNSFRRGEQQTREKRPIIVEEVCQPLNCKNEDVSLMKEKDINSLGNIAWKYQYHAAFAPLCQIISIE